MNLEKRVMIDVGRKYYAPAVIKKLIDKMASVGCKALSLHFSEDMGLGIECPDFPYLAGRDGNLSPAREIGDIPADNRVLSLAEVKDLTVYANQKGIAVIPSYDTPGHLNYTVARFEREAREKGSVSFLHDGKTYTLAYESGVYRFYKDGEELKYSPEREGKYGISGFYVTEGMTARVCGKNAGFSRGISLTNEVGVAFVQAVLTSFAKFFLSLGCSVIDIGGDEMLGFSPAIKDLTVASRWQQLDHWQELAKEKTGLSTAVAYDLLVLYINDLKNRMKKMGYKEVLLWNDEYRRTFDTDWSRNQKEHVQFDTDFTVQYWSSSPNYESPVSLAEEGFSLINCDSTYCYYVLKDKARSNPPTGYLKVNPTCIKEEWTPCAFGENPEKDWILKSEKQKKALRAVMFCIWSDCPPCRTDEEAIAEFSVLLDAWSNKIKEL